MINNMDFTLQTVTYKGKVIQFKSEIQMIEWVRNYTKDLEQRVLKKGWLSALLSKNGIIKGETV